MKCIRALSTVINMNMFNGLSINMKARLFPAVQLEHRAYIHMSHVSSTFEACHPLAPRQASFFFFPPEKDRLHTPSPCPLFSDPEGRSSCLFPRNNTSTHTPAPAI